MGMSTLTSISFTIFGALLRDPAMIIPNGLGIIFSFINITTLLVLPKEKPEVPGVPEVAEKEVKDGKVVIEIAHPLDEMINKDTKYDTDEYKKPASTDKNFTERDQPVVHEEVV